MSSPINSSTSSNNSAKSSTNSSNIMPKSKQIQERDKQVYQQELQNIIINANSEPVIAVIQTKIPGPSSFYKDKSRNNPQVKHYNSSEQQELKKRYQQLCDEISYKQKQRLQIAIKLNISEIQKSQRTPDQTNQEQESDQMTNLSQKCANLKEKYQRIKEKCLKYQQQNNMLKEKIRSLRGMVNQQ